MQDNSFFLLDIENVVRERTGRKFKYIPKFIIRGLEKLIHQEFLNDFLRRGHVGVEFCQECLNYLDVEVKIEGVENLPEAGKNCTFVSNHPLGAIDGVTLGYVLGSHYNGRVKYLVNDLLMNLKGLAPLCIPINKVGRQSRGFPQMVEECFKSDNQVIMFPAGLCSRRINGEIRDLDWGKTFIKKSIQTQRDVVPIYFEGQNSNRFYTIANLCKRLGLRFNLAMLLLPDEMYHSRHKQYRVKIGKPIPWQNFDRSKSHQEWAQVVKDSVYTI